MSSRFRYRRNYNTYSRRIGASRRRPFSSGSSSLVKRARGNMRAANNQNDVSNVVINLMHTVYAGTSAYFSNHDHGEVIAHDYPDFESLRHIGTCAVNIYDLLMKSDFFSSYSGMYDQFRINSIKVKVTPVQWSVFDQSRSANNIIAAGSKYNPGYENVQTVRVPSPGDYVLNSDFDPNEEEGPMNPRYIVPGIAVREFVENNGNNPPDAIIHKYNYRAIPDPRNTPFLEAFPDDINFIVNCRAGEGADPAGGNGTWADGVVSGLTQSNSKQIPIETFEKESYQYPQALTIVTAWDRTGLNEAQVDLIEAGETFWPINDYNGQASRVDARADDPGHGVIGERFIFCTIGDDISSYSSASTKQLVGGASFNLTRYLYPSSQQEKSTYYSTSSLLDQQNKDSEGGTHYMYKLVENGWSKDSLTNIYESAVVPFKPTFLLGILGHNEVSAVEYDYNNGQDEALRDVKTTGMIKPVKFNLEFDIGVTFRGLRKVQVV